MLLIYGNNGLSVRDGSATNLDPRDLDANGDPKPGLLSGAALTAESGEVSFEHVPTESELLSEFPGRAAALAQKAKDEANAPILDELRQLDGFLPRSVEDEWAAIAFDTTKLPQIQQDRLARKRQLRAEIQ